MASRKTTTEFPSLDGMSPSDIEQHLVEMSAERQGLIRTIELFPDRERELLETDAPDSAFIALDVQRKRAHLRRQRLNEREQLATAALDAVHEADKARRWQDFLDRYEILVGAQAEAGRVLEALSAQIWALSQEAARDGFSPYSDPRNLPWHPLRHNQFQIDQMVESVAGLRRIPTPAKKPQEFTLRFLEWTQWGATAYQRSQEGGFVASEAWALVRAQKAVWTDPTRIPPAPPLPKRRSRSTAPINYDVTLAPR